MVTTPPMYIHITHQHNDIFNINILSQCHYQYQHHLISMSFSTSISSHLNVILNINIISSHCHSQHQHHLISMTLSTTSFHINIIINTNIVLYQLLSISSSMTTSFSINVILNINVTSYQLILSIIISSVNHIPHIHTYIVHAWDSHSRGLQTTQV